MNIFQFEVKKKLASTVVWILALGFFSFFTFAFFETFAAGGMSDLLDGFPEALRKAFGLEHDLTTILGYFALLAIYIYLAAAIFSANLGLNAVSIEERDLTADFLISKPVTRIRITTAKIMAGIVHIVIFNIGMGLVSLGGMAVFGGGQVYPFNVFLLIMGGMLIFQILFFALGFALSVLMKRMDSTLPFSLGLSIGLYILYSFDAVLEGTPIRFLVPYHYFDLVYIVENEAFDAQGLVIAIGVIIAAILAGYYRYTRRDIATAM